MKRSAACAVLAILVACGDGASSPGGNDDDDDDGDTTTVTPPFVSVLPATVNVQSPLTTQLTAFTLINNVFVSSPVTWTSSNEAIATVSATGLVTGVAVGTTTITAVIADRTGTSQITVTPANLTLVEVTFSQASIGVDATTAAIATSTDAAGNVTTDRPVVWSTSNALVATVSSAGVVTGRNPGNAVITATGQVLAGSAAVVTGSKGIEVSGAIIFASVTTGANHSCGLNVNGVPYCWGANDVAQLGNGTTEPSPTPLSVLGDRAYASITAGDNHTCARTAANSVYCWGSNEWVQTGSIANPGPPSPPTRVVTAERFKQIDAGGDHTCGIHEFNSTVWCWGSDTRAQLGIPNSFQHFAFPRQPWTPISLAFVSTGGVNSCGLVAGKARCWGDNLEGQLGDGTNVTLAIDAVPVSDAITFDAIAVGGRHACGIVSSGGGTQCWGVDTDHQLGDDGPPASRNVPGLVAGALQFTKLSAGTLHTCGLVADGSAHCWGSNGDGRLGDDTETPRPTPTPVLTNLTFNQIAAGGSHTCALASLGQVYCWGRNEFGQLGDSTTTMRKTPVLVRTVFP